ncbi:MAG: molecular chaperone TorD family protein [Paracoccaceae bacterium]|jgi:TorA maturation chaperone TorD|nr:MAG: molecular chaperone TorD [Rhodobacter sp. BACL10 MAG-121220-bin24]MDA1043052.1 molecular chaperone TorD family protein [Pseudomonadota bacterium]MDO7560385.1 molecular chaperone TorD family protein [Paracoccaceae bacterium]HAQ47288.1 molecular chaperone TorD [Rhodobacter sp.]MDO7567770.1 molecular chaperone TorD family protein [Paracoccaceae bacterium]
MTQAAHSTQVITEEDQLRADLYDFLSALLARPANKALLDKTAKLSGDETDLGRAIGTLAKLAVQSSVKSVEREFNALFIGLGRGELLPYGSYYMTGFLNEKPLALLRDDMAKNSIVRAENIYEPEDNIASVLEMMSGLIMGRFGEVVSLSQQKTFFNRHIAPWAGHFFTDLEGAEGSLFFAPIGAIGRHFMAIEKEAFRITAD